MNRYKFQVLIIFLLLCITSYSQEKDTDEVVREKLVRVEALMGEHKYDKALSEVSLNYENNFETTSQANKEHILNLLIRLTFIIDNREATIKYINEYYDLDPEFSAESIEQATPQLVEFINKFIVKSNENFVFVNKHKQNVNLIPSTVTVYRQEDIEMLGARDLLDLLRLTPGFAEIGDNNERVVGIRGTSSTSLQDILFLINGHRLTDILTNTTAPDWIDLDYVDQIEIVRGPGSALYGGTAFSGVVNIITKTASKESFSQMKVIAGNGSSMSSFNRDVNNLRLNYQFSRKISNKEGLYFSGSYRHSGGSQIDYSKDDHKAILADYSADTVLREADLTGVEYINKYGPSYDLLLKYSNKALQITANAQSSTYVFSRASSLNLWNTNSQESLSQSKEYQQLSRDTTMAGRRRIDKREFVQVSYDLLNNNRNKNKLLAKASGDHFKKDFFITPYSYGISSSTALQGDEYRFTGSLEYSTDSLFNGKNNKVKNHFLFGGEAFVNSWKYAYYTEQGDSTYVLDGLGDYFSNSHGDARKEYVAALFLQNERDLIQDKLIGTIGVRLNYHNVYSDFSEFNYGEQFSPRFALVYLPTGNKENIGGVNFKLMYNSAFTPPPFLYRKGGVSGFVGSTELKPQKIESGEFVMFGSINEKLSYSSQFYINKIDNYIDRPHDTYLNDSIERVHSGLEMELRYKNQKVTDRLMLGSFINFATVSVFHFEEAGQHSYLEALNGDILGGEDFLTLFPKVKTNLAVYGGYSLSEEATIKKITFGLDVEHIGASTVYSDYVDNGTGEWIASSGTQKQTIAAATIVNSRIKLHANRFNVGLSARNIGGVAYDLPTPIYKIKRKRGEGRMIYLSFELNLAKKK